MIAPLPVDPILTGTPAVVFAIFLGLIFGSFASALAYRIPRDIGWGRTRSSCPSCGHALGVRDLVPLFSWVFLRGRCRYCKAPIGLRYPLIEGTTMMLCVVVAMLHGVGVPGLVLMVAMPFLVALLVIDMDHMILPDQLNIILFVLGIFYIFVFDPFRIEIALMGAVLYAGLLWVTGWIMRALLKKEAVGFGDVKFFAVAGLWLGPWMLPFFLCLSGVAGVVFGLIWKSMRRGVVFPFGPALIASFIFFLLAGDRIMALWGAL
jgi:prepilin signal peptidase PulO-like enzyme (type II secretory pathway)